MAIPCSKKLLLVIGILVLVLSPSASVEESEENSEMCKQGEVHDKDGECCIPNMIDEEKCTEAPSDMAIATAVTLIGSFVFLISLQFFVNHPDIDMQRNAYRVISSTVSIFSAVLMFQSIDGLVENLIIEPYAEILPKHCFELLIDGIHMLLWYTVTQITIAKVAGALKSDEERDALLSEDKDKEEIEQVKQDREIECQCWGTVFAHLTGFSSINFWVTLQQLTPFNQSPLLALLLLPISVVVQWGLQRLTDKCRESWSASGDGKKDWFEDKWDETCEEAENDIMGLTLSVIIVNAARFGVNVWFGHDCLPNAEQKEEGEACEFDRSISLVCTVLLVGLVFVTALFIAQLVVFRLFPELAEEKEEKEEKNETEEKHEKHEKEDEEKGHGECEGEGGGEEEGGEEEESNLVERVVGVLLITLSMGFAWCVFHGSHRLLMVVNPAFLGKEKNAATLAVALALIVTYVAWILMRILDCIADLPEEWTPPAVDESIRTVIDAMSIFIGFAWEQTFDESVDNLAEFTRKYGGSHAPAFAKLVIGSGCVGVVFMAWKLYILPFVVKEGWKFGFVFSKRDLLHASHSLAEHDPEFAESVYQDILRCCSGKSIEYEKIPEHEIEALKRELVRLKKVEWQYRCASCT